MAHSVSVSSSKEELIDQALKLIDQMASDAIQNSDRFSIALAGGSTPKPLYEKLAQSEQDWQKWHIFWGDERFVPPTHPDSNERMARLAWLDQVDIPASNIHPLSTHYNSPQEAAEQNELTLKEALPTDSSNPWPQIDLTLLGMGDDGHTASLFPGTKALKNIEQWVTVGMKGEDPRLTLTIPAINNSRNVMFLIAGKNKNSILKEIWSDANSADPYPIQAIQATGEAYWMLDQDAGMNIDFN